MRNLDRMRQDGVVILEAGYGIGREETLCLIWKSADVLGPKRWLEVNVLTHREYSHELRISSACHPNTTVLLREDLKFRYFVILLFTSEQIE